MNIPGLLFLLITQFLAGRGLLAMLNVRMKMPATIAVANFTGVVIFSLIPMVMEMLHIPITANSTILSISITTLALCLIPFRRYDFSVFRMERLKIKAPAIYELFFIVLLVLLLIPSVWRTYFYPPNARDVLSGPEAIAEYAVKEHSLNNSVFTVSLLDCLPNLQKPPFITDLQIIYKLLVHPFGQLWLAVIVLSFMSWLYILLRELLHPVICGMAILLFISIPEVYGYTYIILWDYANMVYFFAGCYFLHQYISSNRYNYFVGSFVLFGFATFVRLETLIFIGMLLPLPVWSMWKNGMKIPRIIANCVIFLAFPYFFYFIWMKVFVPYYFPPELAIKTVINFSPAKSYFDWFSEINSYLLFGGINIPLYALYIYVFLLVLVLDLVIFRKTDKDGRFYLYAIAVIYLGMPLLTYLTDWFNITTAKRGLFKMFPLMLMYMRYSLVLRRISGVITAFENPANNARKHKLQPAKQVSKADKKKKKK